MILTKAIAKNHIGEYIDSYKRRFGYYPMKIIEFPDRSLGLMDAVGVCTRIEDTGCNVRHYDFIYSKMERDGGSHNEA